MAEAVCHQPSVSGDEHAMTLPRSVYAALILLGLIWGSSFYFIKVLLDDFGPWTITFLRSACGLIIIVLIMLVMKKPFAFRSIPWIAVSIVALINTSVPWALIGLGETRITSSLASVLNATTPICTIVVGMLFFGAKSGKLQWLGISMATIGVVILVGDKPDSFQSVDVVGVVCLLAAACCYGFGSQLSKRLLNVGSLYQITLGTLLGSAITSGIVALAVEPVSLTPLAAPSVIGMIFGLGGLGSGVAFLLYYYTIQKGTPEFTSMVTYIIPSTAIFWGFILLDEKMHWNLLAGLVIILTGVFLAGRKKAR